MSRFVLLTDTAGRERYVALHSVELIEWSEADDATAVRLQDGLTITVAAPVLTVLGWFEA